jgi:cytochrome oxidase Cu insertion factor (SCO1/SenC/PrrC family)
MSKPLQTGSEPGDQARSGRRTFVILVLISILPVTLASFLAATGWRPQGKSLQHGELFSPPRPLADIELRDPAGKSRTLGELRKKWLLLYVGSMPCQDDCRRSLHALQQIRLAQGRDMQRVERVFLVKQGPTPELPAIAAEFPGLTVLTGERPALNRLAVDSERFYIVDPLGNLVLGYGPDADPTGIHKDLARLLRLSQVD